MRILIWAYKYSPQSGVGGRRWRKFAKYLARQGHEVVIATSFENVSQGQKPLDLVENVFIYRIGSLGQKLHLGLSRWSRFYQRVANRFFWIWNRKVLGHFDPGETWGRYAIEKVKSLIRQRSIDVLVVTGGPCSLNFIATEIKTHFPDLFLVQDFRDIWNLEVTYSEQRLGHGSRAKKRSMMAEEKAIRSADLILNVSKGQSDLMMHPDGVAPRRFQVLTNGYDPDDHQHASSSNPESLRFVHAGSVRWRGFDGLAAFLEAVGQLEKILETQSFIVDFYGPPLHLPQDGISQRMISKFFRFHGSVPPERIASEVACASAGIIFFDKETGYGTKTFDYLGARKPFMAIAPKGELRDLCDQLQLPHAGYDADEISTALLDVLDDPEFTNYKPERVETYSVPHLVRQFETLVETIQDSAIEPSSLA